MALSMLMISSIKLSDKMVISSLTIVIFSFCYIFFLSFGWTLTFNTENCPGAEKFADRGSIFYTLEVWTHILFRLHFPYDYYFGKSMNFYSLTGSIQDYKELS